MNYIKLVIVFIIFSSCDTYYQITNVEDIYLYNTPKKDDFTYDIVLIHAGTPYYSTVENKKFRKAKFDNRKGYVYNPYFDNPYYTPTIPSTGSTSGSQSSSSQSSSTSNSTYNYSSSNYSTRPKTVNVKGYYRKDGTYVRPHTRSAPRRK